MTLAAGIYSELGSSLLLYPLKDLCSYSGVVPRVKQSGGPEKPARTGSVRKGCNRILKNYLVQAAAKMRDCGPEGLQDAYEQLDANGQHADFVIARRLLRIFKFMMVYQSIYLPPRLRRWDRESLDPLRQYLSDVREKIAAKWSTNKPIRSTIVRTRESKVEAGEFEAESHGMIQVLADTQRCLSLEYQPWTPCLMAIATRSQAMGRIAQDI